MQQRWLAFWVTATAGPLRCGWRVLGGSWAGLAVLCFCAGCTLPAPRL